jgi:hypothetical protein
MRLFNDGSSHHFIKVLAYLEMPTRGDEDVLRLDV